MAFDAAVMREYRYNGQAEAQVLQDGVSDVERQRGIAFTQHQQAGHVIDLRVHGHHGCDTAVTHTTRRLKFGMGRDLRKQVGRRVENEPVLAVRADHDRRLRTPLRIQRAVAYTVAIPAVAVPLRKTAARGRTKYLDLHAA